MLKYKPSHSLDRPIKITKETVPEDEWVRDTSRIREIMKYQLSISKRIPERTTRQSQRIILRPELEIGEAGYWQHRIQDIIDELELNEHVTVRVAK